MPVFREPNRLRGDAPSLDKIHYSLWNDNWTNQYASAQNAARSLRAVAYDLNATVRSYFNPVNMDAGAHEDAMDLSKLLKYYTGVVFHYIALYREHAFPLMPLSPVDDDFKETALAIMHNVVLAEAFLLQMDANELLDHPEYAALTDGWREDPAVDVPEIPYLGTVELLCRIAAEGCVNLLSFQQRLVGNGGQGGFELHRMPALPANLGWYLSRPKGIPATVFACTGHNPNSTFVVTSSQDQWAGFGAMQTWVTEVRQHIRPSNAPVQGVGLNNVPALSTQIRTLFLALDQTGNTTQRAPRRLQLLQNWVNIPGNAAPHQGELAMPLSCPTFGPKARCFRCRAMFQYNVTQDVANLETTNMGYLPPGLKAHEGWVCAETIAQAYCTLAQNH